MMLHLTPSVLGWWTTNGTPLATDTLTCKRMLFQLQHPVYLIEKNGQYAAVADGYATLGDKQTSKDALPLVGYTPACPPENLGDPGFCAEYGLQYPYIAGAMANGITSAEIVEKMGQNGMLGFFGAAGLSLSAVETAIHRISSALGERPYGFNLIHSPNDPKLEAAVVDLYLKHGVQLVEASAFLGLTLPVVRYRVHGIRRGASGQILTPNRVIAKVSRIEVATHFFSPAPERFLRQLVNSGDISPEQAELAAQTPIAQDITAEADSGGHTDNRPAISLIPTMIALRDHMQAKYGYAQKLRVGAAGGISTPMSAVAAFSMGAAYILSGSVNQACVESGTSGIVRQMLAEVRQADITMAPSADMFELGVKVQVLKRGTMFAMRAAKLYEMYRKYDRIEDIPTAEREMLEKKILRHSFEAVWEHTQHYFLSHDPSQIERGNRDPKHKMALIFRWYLGLASYWANSGEPSRKIDYQVWCGPAMGAFNEWVKGSFLEQPDNRHVVTLALNILYGASVISRLNTLRMQGVQFPPEFWKIAPLTREELSRRLTTTDYTD